MAKRSFRIALAIVAGSFLIIGLVTWWIIAGLFDYPNERHGGKGEEVTVEIEQGMSFPQIAERLVDRGVISHPVRFRLFAMKEGATTKVRPGRYLLRDDMTPREVLARLLEGVKDVLVSVTIPEGLDMLEVFAEIDKAGVANAADLERMARDPAFLASKGIEGDSLEGYLFPDTYKFVLPSPPAKVLEQMLKRHREVWDKIRADKRRQIEDLEKRMGWSDRDILIMASIVEKEAVVQEERPRIAQVFINRLTDDDFQPKLLQTDPTIRYGCLVPVHKTPACEEWFKEECKNEQVGSAVLRRCGRLHTAQLHDADNLYSTYTHEKLPPGPIGNPGEASLRATVEPDGSRYFYFVAKEDRRHHAFARSKEEHDKNVEKYQK
ncbi:MAG TPA: endolytic transglycosylase MltG [Kofleriaceae bacterium]|nr:endolytic transglycosylase MltG [Kofleriaceae bacterium]